MYTGNNPSAKRSQSELSQAFLRLLSQYSFSEITITMICQEAVLSRQTFYQMFNGKDEIIRYLIINDYGDFEEGILKKENINLEEFAEYTFTFFFNKKTLLKLLIQQGLQHLFIEEVQNKLAKVLRLFKHDNIELESSIYAFLVGGLSAMILHQIEHDDIDKIHHNAVTFSNLLGNPHITLNK